MRYQRFAYFCSGVYLGLVCSYQCKSNLTYCMFFTSFEKNAINAQHDASKMLYYNTLRV